MNKKYLYKKIISRLLVLAFILIVAAACKPIKKEDEIGSKKKVTVTTSFLYDMVRQLLDDEVDLKLIIPFGEDPHLYAAKPKDLKKIQEADLVLYHGLNFEGKLIKILEKKGFSITETFDLNKLSKLKGDGKEVIDPHFWFDIGLYKQALDQLARRLEDLLPDQKELIETNLKAYHERLDQLDKNNRKLLQEIPETKRYLITPHDAFNYFSKAYNFKVLAPQGVSSNSEVSNKDLEETANFIVKHEIKAIFSESTTNPERMQKLQEICKSKGFDVKIVDGKDNELFSDSLAGLGDKGSSYIDMYQHNVILINDNLK
ncbi:MAG: zinc ABC transporter substrate-binding protein [Tissierellia bacterium]|nr:zinc ABC transporter substrate-binding protein [Tissierellia bacterium]